MVYSCLFCSRKSPGWAPFEPVPLGRCQGTERWSTCSGWLSCYIKETSSEGQRPERRLKMSSTASGGAVTQSKALRSLHGHSEVGNPRREDPPGAT